MSLSNIENKAFDFVFHEKTYSINPDEVPVMGDLNKIISLPRTILLNGDPLFEDYDIPSMNKVQQIIYQINDQRLGYSLRNRAMAICDLEARLKDATEHSVRNNLFNVLRSFLTIGILAAGILGTIALFPFSPGLASLIGILAFCLYFGLGYYNQYRAVGQIYDKAGPVGALLCGPFYPLFEEYLKLSALNEELPKVRSYFEAEFTQGFLLFKESGRRLKNELELAITTLRSNEIQLNQLNQQNALLTRALESVKKSIHESIEINQKALDDVNVFIDYYAKFALCT